MRVVRREVPSRGSHQLPPMWIDDWHQCMVEVELPRWERRSHGSWRLLRQPLRCVLQLLLRGTPGTDQCSRRWWWKCTVGVWHRRVLSLHNEQHWLLTFYHFMHVKHVNDSINIVCTAQLTNMSLEWWRIRSDMTSIKIREAYGNYKHPLSSLSYSYTIYTRSLALSSKRRTVVVLLTTPNHNLKRSYVGLVGSVWAGI